jgi:hypothetical protein
MKDLVTKELDNNGESYGTIREKFIKERNKALLSMNREKLIWFFRKHSIAWPDDENMFWANVHFARLQVTSFSEEVRRESADWLIAKGFLNIEERDDERKVDPGIS